MDKSNRYKKWFRIVVKKEHLRFKDYGFAYGVIYIIQIHYPHYLCQIHATRINS
jgi:hypothetical protein